jgi:hypothetical protein
MRRYLSILVLFASLLFGGAWATARMADSGSSRVEKCVQDQNASPRFIDNSDGTITDRATCLMWEKKDDAGGIHDKDNLYTWSKCDQWPYCEPSGTAFTEFLVKLNTPPCFAGHCDWRLPKSAGRPDWGDAFGPTGQPAELESIVDAPYPGFLVSTYDPAIEKHSFPPTKCKSTPCVDPVFNNNCGAQSSGNKSCTADGKGGKACSCTLPQTYMSGSSFGQATAGAFPWSMVVVDFQRGWAMGTHKKAHGPVRAVRSM